MARSRAAEAGRGCARLRQAPRLVLARTTALLARWQWSPKPLVFCRLASRAVSERDRHLNQLRTLLGGSTGAPAPLTIPPLKSLIGLNAGVLEFEGHL